MAADGSIIIDTHLDTSGISSSINEIQAAFKDLAESVKGISQKIDSVLNEGIEQLNDSFSSLQQRTREVEDSLNGLESSADNVGSSLSRGFNEANATIPRTGRNVNLLGRQFEGLGTIVKRIGILIGSAFAVGKLIQFGKECLELGSDLTEVQNVVDVTFTTMSDKVNEFAKNAMTSAGLSETMAKQYVGTFGAMSKSFGFSEQQAYDMSTALTQLTGDVASFYNISQDEAYVKLKSVFTGETETLKDLGVVLTQNALDQYALANGYGKTTSEMTEQEKVALRLAFVQKQLSAASGDFIRTSDSWANQVRVMQLQLQSLKATVGQGLINLFTPVLKVINILLGKLATLANAFKSFTELITGKKSSGQTGASGAGLAGTDAIADTAVQYGNAADNAEKLADATNDTADATKKATKAAKGYLSPLDEINNYSTDKSTDSSSKTPSATGGLVDQMKDAVQNVDYGKVAEGETVLDKISDSAKKLANLFKKLWKPFQDAWKKEGKNTIDAANIALSGIAKLAKSVGRSLMEVWTNGTGTTMLTTMLRIAQNVLKTIGNIASGFADAWNKNNVGTQIIQNIADALVVVMQFIERIAADTATWAANLDFYPLLESISNLTSAFAPILESIGNVLEWIYNNIVLPMLKWVIEVGLPTVINLVAKVATFLADHQSIVEAFGAALIGAFAAAKIAELASGVIKSASGIATAVKGLIALMTGTGGIMGGIKAIATAIGTGGIFAIAVGAAIAIGVLLYKNWDEICAAATKLKDWVVERTRELSESATRTLSNLKEKIANVWNIIKTSTSTTWNAIKKTLSGLWNSLKSTASTVFNAIKTKVTGVWDKIKDKTSRTWESVTTFISTKVEAIKNAITNKFNAARDAVRSAFEGIVNFIKAPINQAISIVNNAVGMINNAIGGIESAFSFGPWTVPTPFGSKTIGFHATFPRIGTIPYLASGAVIPPRSEFLAVLGDQKKGNNLEAPESLLRQIVREESGKRQGDGNTYNVTVNASGRKLLDIIISEAEMRRNRNGKNPFELA
jgi:phage-related protein|nr:MAG TPA: minor tail protein [Caudoviricetes sp.]